MTYVDGFVIPVPRDTRERFKRHVTEFAPIFKEAGALRVVECWAHDIPDGSITDFRESVQAKDDEEIVFSWVEYPDRAARDAARDKLMEDPRMERMGDEMPFDGQRLIHGGFGAFVDERGSGRGQYMDGFVLAVPETNRDAYRVMAERAAKVFVEYGANRVVEAWGDDVPDGKVTDFRRAVRAEETERVVFSWIEWPSKPLRDEAWQKVAKDERMQPDKSNLPFDAQRMFWGGFEPLIDA
jgi:uncharacterized protein YbaA (DUF1428 family)